MLHLDELRGVLKLIKQVKEKEGKLQKNKTRVKFYSQIKTSSVVSRLYQGPLSLSSGLLQVKGRLSFQAIL
jgi:hypothetical protein